MVETKVKVGAVSAISANTGDRDLTTSCSVSSGEIEEEENVSFTNVEGEEETMVGIEDHTGRMSLEEGRRKQILQKKQKRTRKETCSRPCTKHCKPIRRRKKMKNKDKKKREFYQWKRRENDTSRQVKVDSSSPRSSSTENSQICCGINVQQCAQQAANWLTRAVQAAWFFHRNCPPSSSAATARSVHAFDAQVIPAGECDPVSIKQDNGTELYSFSF